MNRRRATPLRVTPTAPMSRAGRVAPFCLSSMVFPESRPLFGLVFTAHGVARRPLYDETVRGRVKTPAPKLRCDGQVVAGLPSAVTSPLHICLEQLPRLRRTSKLPPSRCRL